MIDLDIADGVAFITLNAPATRNALNNELAAQFVAACDEVDRNPAVGAAVIRGAGGTFCSGAERGHLDEVGRDPVEEGRYAALGGTYRVFTRAGQLEVPTIAAVRGAAVGAGVNLLLATDLRIVAEDARRPAVVPAQAGHAIANRPYPDAGYPGPRRHYLDHIRPANSAKPRCVRAVMLPSGISTHTLPAVGGNRSGQICWL